MTTHRRAWTTRAGVVVALAAGALVAIPAAPALADEPTVQVTSLSTGTLSPGQRVTLKFAVKNNAEGILGSDPFDIAVTSTFPELRCESGCDTTQTIKRGESQEFTATLVAGNVPAGQSKSGKVQIRAQGESGTGSAERAITVRSAAPPMVKSVTGKVTDIDTGKPIAGAIVAMSDSQNHRYTTTTGSSGSYRFTASESAPISPGEIVIAAQAENYKQSDFKKVNGVAGQSVTGPTLALKSSVAPTPSASPSPTPEAADEEDEASPGPEQTAGAVDAAPTANEESGGFGSWLLIILGGLLVALGVGAIVLLLVRRKENAEEGADEADEAPSGGRRGGDDATRVATRAGAGASDATMVTGSLADAPTMLQNIPPVDDEYPDPYGAPLPAAAPAGPQPPGYGGGYPDAQTQPSYGSADATAVYSGGLGGGYGDAPASGGGGYGDAPASGAGYGNAPSSGGGYGGPGGGPGGYGSPAGGPQGGYGNPPDGPGGYGAPGGGPGGYGNPPDGTGGYGNAPASGGGGYGGPADGPGGYGGRDYPPPGGGPGAPGYGGGPQGGYGERYDEPTGRYDGGGEQYGGPGAPYQPGPYGREADAGRGGYGPEPGYGGQGGGYDQGGYDQRGGGYGAPTGGGYGQGYGGPGGGYDQGGNPGYGQGGYDQRGGYDAPGGPEQRGGYGERGYGQGGYYDESQPSGDRRHGGEPRHGGGGAPPPGRAERRPLDWLDD